MGRVVPDVELPVGDSFTLQTRTESRAPRSTGSPVVVDRSLGSSGASDRYLSGLLVHLEDEKEDGERSHREQQGFHGLEIIDDPGHDRVDLVGAQAVPECWHVDAAVGDKVG